MKNATFKKIYTTETTFGPNDLTQFIEKALSNEYCSLKDRNEYESLFTIYPNKTLKQIFEENDFKLIYLGPDNLGSNHIFNITNDKETIEIIATIELFSVNFNVI